MADASSAVKVPAAGVKSRSTWLEGHAINLLLLALGLAGIALVLINTRLGAYLSDDSYYYIYPARDLLAGKGFHPSYIFAPLFPLALAGISLLGLDALVAARWLNAILFGVNIFLVGRVTRRAGAPAAFALLAAGLVLLADLVIEAHGWAMSEALSFTFMLLGLDQTLAYLATGKRVNVGIAAGAAALAALTRYAAVPVIAAIALTLLLFAPVKKIIGRLKEAVLFGIISLTPVVIYGVRNQIISGHPVRYQQYFFEPLTRGQADWFLYNWLSLFFPGRFLHGRETLAGLIFVLLSASIILGAGVVYRKQLNTLVNSPTIRGMFLFIAVIGMELLMLYLARGLTELDVLNPRYLVPLLIVFLMLVTLFGDVWQVAGKWVRFAIIAVFTLFLVYYAYRTVDFTQHTVNRGLGYSNAGWHDSETIPYIRAHPEMVNIASTGEMGIYFWTGLKPKVLSDFPDPNTLKEYLCQSNGTLFIMDQMPTDIYGMTRDSVVKGLQLVNTFNDSSMYRCPPGN